MTWLAVGVAGALGAVSRHVVDRLVTARVGGRWPWGTVVVNVTGSLLAGVVVGLASSAAVPDGTATVMAGGFLGAYTTFSTAVYDVVLLVDDGARARAVATLLLPLLAATAAAALGWWLAT